MKKFLAASLAAFLLFTAAACTRQSSPQQTPEPAQPVTQEPAAQPEAPAQEPAEPIRITPNQQGSATPSDAVWLDEPDTIQTDLEEIVTCTYTLPHLTLETDEASAAANAVFDTNFMFLSRATEGTPLYLFQTLLGNHLWGYPILMVPLFLVLYGPQLLRERREKHQEAAVR